MIPSPKLGAVYEQQIVQHDHQPASWGSNDMTDLAFLILRRAGEEPERERLAPGVRSP